MHNEDTSEEVRCPFCEETGDCPHLLAVIDLTFSGCSGGYAYSRYNEFHRAVISEFGELIEQRIRKTFSADDSDLDHLWGYMANNFSADQIDLEIDSIDELIVELLFEAGGIDIPAVDDEGGPGQSSSTTVVYAEDPEATFNKAISLLEEKLAQGTA